MGLFKPHLYANGPTAIYHRTLCFIFWEERVLLIFRPRPPDPGVWNAVGGKIDRGEDPLDAAQRELWEEAGIRPALDFRGVATVIVRSTAEHWAIFLFSATVDTPEVAPSSEGPLCWATAGEIAALPVLPDLTLLLPHMRNPDNGVILAKFVYAGPDPATLETSEIRGSSHGALTSGDG
jgi:8-oxo-dGTP pyrophosphatase MutT (NUDIX family)